MQANDIDDIALLRFIDAKQHQLRDEHGTGWLPWVCMWDFEPPYTDLPGNLFRAKMATLIKRKLVSGCACGCRGDYHLTTRGRAYITAGGTK
jgi:hypothetical protein